MKIIDGKKISKIIKEEIKNEVDQIIKNGGRAPHLAAVLVGSDGASLTYVGSKVRSCKEVGFKSTLIKLSEDITEKSLLAKIEELNNNDKIDGFIVQLPLPKHIDEDKILMAVNPNKDVDGFHPTNFGKMALNMETFISATPYGIIELIRRYKIDTTGKNTVVIGRSNIVGRPISILMSRKGNPGDSTVTLVHSRTKNLESFTKNADIIISDNRFGFRSSKTTNIYLTHQLKIKGPFFLMKIVNIINELLIQRFDHCWVPDFENSLLSGELSNSSLKKTNIGPLSRFEKSIAKKKKYKYKYLAIISGPEPQRSLLEDEIQNSFLKTNEYCAIINGLVNPKEISNGKITSYPHLETNSFRELLTKSEFIICRSGYSSIMDVCFLQKKVLFIEF